jgi:hypothetical protein
MKLRTMRFFVMCITAEVLGAAIPGCSTLSVSGSGNLEVTQPSIDGFTELAVDDAFEVTVVPGAVYNVTVTVDDNVVQYVMIEETGDRLRLGLDPDRDYRDVTLSGASTLRLPATSVSRATFNLSGASVVEIDGTCGDIEAEGDGAGTLDLGDLSAGNVDMRLDGASRHG